MRRTTSALIRVTTTRERGKRPVIEITLPERILKDIKRDRPEEMVLNLGPKESVRITNEAFKKILTEMYERRRR